MLEQNQNNETNTQYSLFGASTTKSTVHNGLLMISSHNPVGAANLTTASSSSSDLSSLIANNNNNFIAPSLPPLVQQKSQPQQPQQYLFNELSLNNSSSNSSSDRKKLFVGNLPPSTRLEDLVELFGRFGRVNEQLSVVKDDNYAFVHFYAEEAAELALRELNGTLFNKKYIRVQYSNSNGHIKKAVSSKLLSLTRSVKSSILSEITGNANNRMHSSTSSSLLAGSIDIPNTTTTTHPSFLKQSSSMYAGFNPSNRLLNSQSAYVLNQPDHPGPHNMTGGGGCVRAIRGATSTVRPSPTMSSLSSQNMMPSPQQQFRGMTPAFSCTNDLYRSYLCLKLLEQHNQQMNKELNLKLSMSSMFIPEDQ